jgi:hypothetical protein
MSDDSFKTGKCAKCGEPLSLEVGITNYGTKGGSKLYCTPCAPKHGKGYTLSDLQQMREDGQVERAKYEMSLMELVGPDVYFAIKGGSARSPMDRLIEMRRRTAEFIDSLIGDDPEETA